MKLGILVETEEGLDWEHWRRTVALAERLGFESLWISDHLRSPWSATRHGLDPWMALAVAASETQRLIFGPLVSPIMLREPAVVERMAESLDALSAGRLVIGLGLGWNADEHSQAGIAFPPISERARRLVECVERIRRGLGARRIPILIGGAGARSTLPIVARCADEWNITGGSPAVYQQAAVVLDRLCREIDRDPGEIHRSVAAGVLIGRDARELTERGRRLRSLVQPLAEVADVSHAVRAMGWLVGTPTEVVEQIRQLAAVGVERVMLGSYDLDDTGVLEILSAKVLPAVA
jgi:alkanesulfonate monooxygenase SsuD/methylene tetrahydromethanopterin reductase-like flavin-dependent oxidoreductase (luciferase family)